MSKYWEISIGEILSEHDISVPDSIIESIARDVESCASVKFDYEPEISGNNEVDELKKKIAKLERARGCTHCGGKGGATFSVGSSHSSWSDCRHCGGSGVIY